MPTRTLMRRDPHMEGEDVRAAQQRLLDLGYRHVGQADGLYGPQTEAAVRAFQQTNVLEADGVLGPQTSMRLFAAAAIPAWTVVPVVEGVLCGKDRGLLGATTGSTWLKREAAGAMLRGGETYRLYDSAGSLGTATGSTPKLFTEPPLVGAYALQLTPNLGERDFIAVGGTWEPRPRLANKLTGASDRERAVALVTGYLRGAGIAQPVVQANDVKELVQVDLDGDGQQELLISAERYEPGPDESTRQDAYSVILLQHGADGTFKLDTLDHDVYPGVSSIREHESNSVFLILDLNGDGRMEIVTQVTGFEWSSIAAYSLDQGQVTRRLETSCGV